MERVFEWSYFYPVNFKNFTLVGKSFSNEIQTQKYPFKIYPHSQNSTICYGIVDELQLQFILYYVERNGHANTLFSIEVKKLHAGLCKLGKDWCSW